MKWQQTILLIISLFLLYLYIKHSDKHGLSFGGASLGTEEGQTSDIKTSSYETNNRRNSVYSKMPSLSQHVSLSASEVEEATVYTGCQHAFLEGVRKSGVYRIALDGRRPFTTWCDFDSSGGWMITPRIEDTRVTYLKRWRDYVNRLGNLWDTYWRGVNDEGAFKGSVGMKTGITQEGYVAATKMQAISRYLSPAYQDFENSTMFEGCQDAFIRGVRVSGVYVIARTGLSPFRVWCDFDSSGGWMVMQRRVDGTEDFFKRWTEYEKGFGNLWGEYWLGLTKIHLMTAIGVDLSIYMEDFDDVSAWANYTGFRIGDAASQYTLNVAYVNGTAGDSLSFQNGCKFSTWDRDNDEHSSSCAQLLTGSWWYRACHQSNLNGRYERGVSASFATSNCWMSFRGFYYGLKVTVMRIRA